MNLALDLPQREVPEGWSSEALLGSALLLCITVVQYCACPAQFPALMLLLSEYAMLALKIQYVTAFLPKEDFWFCRKGI